MFQGLPESLDDGDGSGLAKCSEPGVDTDRLDRFLEEVGGELGPLVGDEVSWAAVPGEGLVEDFQDLVGAGLLVKDSESERHSGEDVEDDDELEAKESDLSFVKLDGNVGCIVNGAGLAMGTMDIIQLSGGRPANFLDVGGSSNPQKVLNALKIILRNKKIKACI